MKKIPFPFLVAVFLPALAGPAPADQPRLVITPAPASAANAPTPTPSPRRVIRASEPAVDADKSKLTRFDLDFPGGTPAELAAAISRATGKHLNLVIPSEQADARIMPLKVDNVTVREVFAAISLASEHEQAYIVDSLSPGGPRGFNYRKVKMTFDASGPEGAPYSDETVWAFRYNGVNEERIAAMAASKTPPPPQVGRYFQLASYLESYSIEDITTAIQTGWRMAKVEPMPQISFHRETKLLIAVGPLAQVEEIPQVLAELAKGRPVAAGRLAQWNAEYVERTDKLGLLTGKRLKIATEKPPGWEVAARRIDLEIEGVNRERNALLKVRPPEPDKPAPDK